MSTPSSTPSYIATALRVSGWEQVTEETWQRPGAHPDVHSWPVANLIRRTGEPHHQPPAGASMATPRPPRATPTAARPPRQPGQPRKADLIRRVAEMRDVQGMTLAAIAAEIGGKSSRVHYLYRQANKLQPATTR